MRKECQNAAGLCLTKNFKRAFLNDKAKSIDSTISNSRVLIVGEVDEDLGVFAPNRADLLILYSFEQVQGHIDAKLQ